jgi:CRP-like cAMP-binding protein
LTVSGRCPLWSNNNEDNLNISCLKNGYFRLTNKAILSARKLAFESTWLSRENASFCEKLLTNSKVVFFRKNEPIIRLGEKGSNLYFLIEGSIHVFVPQANLEMVLSHMVSPSEWFGVFGAFTGECNIAEYISRTSSCALIVPQSQLGLLEDDPAFYKSAAYLLARSLKRYLELSAGVSGLNVKERVRSKLYALSGTPSQTEKNEFKLILSQDELAKLSSTSRTVVSEVLSELANEGIIIVGYRHIVIRNRDRLLKE